jgi:Bacterial protein of unknown function (DUF899)
MSTVSRYPIAELAAFRKRMGWTVPYVSSLGQRLQLRLRCRLHRRGDGQRTGAQPAQHWDHSDTPASKLAADETIPSANDMPPPDAVGMSAFALEDGIVYHTYSAYARGIDAMWSRYPWLDRAPKGRNEPTGGTGFMTSTTRPECPPFFDRRLLPQQRTTRGGVDGARVRRAEGPNAWRRIVERRTRRDVDQRDPGRPADATTRC